MFSALAEPGAVIPLTFVAPMPGFPETGEWELSHWGDPEGPFKTLTSKEEGGPSFVVVELGVFWPTANVELDAATVEQLGIEQVEDVALFVILTLGDSLETTTANLLGPLVVNVNTNKVLQMVRTDTEHTTREALLAA